jgi:hypothetical protein
MLDMNVRKGIEDRYQRTDDRGKTIDIRQTASSIQYPVPIGLKLKTWKL